MANTPAVFEFRPDGRSGPCCRDLADMAREFEPSSQSIRNWSLRPTGGKVAEGEG
jgi:hypothetical protein